jgi:ATPase subunit of ABC transporter with duplicated ATPase domains
MVLDYFWQIFNFWSFNMSHFSKIIIQNLFYKTQDNKNIFEDLTISLGFGKTAIIGKNGCGKTTLVKLIAGEFLPTSGSIRLNGTVAICPQDFSIFNYNTIADVFGATEKLEALERIASGSINSNDFTILNDDWGIQNRIQEQLKECGLEYLSLWRKLSTLSGGEITRLWLAKTFATNIDFLLLDEPTNNLDIASRKMLYHKITNYKNKLIIISHDRKLLELMDQIIEINTSGIKIYGGNYYDYLEQKNTEKLAKERHFEDAKKTMQKTKQSIQTSQEKRAQRETQGKRLGKSGSQAPIILDAMKRNASKNQGKMATRENQMLIKAQKVLDEARANIEINEEFKFALPKTNVSNGKLVLALEQVSFMYPTNKEFIPIINNFNLNITGPERVALVGNNGCGKTTLVKLITGELTPTSGKITQGIKNIGYLDQQISLLKPNISVLDNFKIFNPDFKENESRLHLARFLFRNQEALKPVAYLSSGEKIRAMLACILMAKQPPQLLILDEPTNYLDLISISTIEEALNCYEGALIVISHDETFTENIAITKTISL